MLAAQNLSLRRGGVRVLEALDAALAPGAADTACPASNTARPSA